MTVDDNLDLRWTNSSHLGDLRLRIFKDKADGQAFIDLPVADTGVFNLKKDGEADKYDAVGDGDYFWQVMGNHGGSTVSKSDVYKFTVKSHFDLISPELRVPAANARLPYETVNNGGQFFTWAAVPGVDKYHVTVESDPVKAGSKPVTVLDKDIEESTQTRIPQLQPGRYSWFVTSVSNEGEQSKTPAPRKFQVESLPRLQWSDNDQQETYLYVTQAPSMKPQWKAGIQAGYLLYKVTVKSDDGFEKTVETKVPETLVDVPKDGLYHVLVEAYDGGKIVVAKSTLRDFQVQPRPLLEAPKFSERTPASIQAANNGSANFQWNPVQGAKGYVLVIKDPSGKTMKTEKFGATSNATLNRLLPGQYKVSLSSVDEYNRVGSAGEEKTLIVPNVSDARPPAFKKFKIQ
jgi:flagellar hook assembly protein FlgD